MKRGLDVWGYNWATLSLGGHKYKDLLGFPGWGLDARLTTFFCKISLVRFKGVKTRWSNLSQIWQNLRRDMAKKELFCQ
jgi:hypothetical protein